MNTRAWCDPQQWVACDLRWAQALNRAATFRLLTRTCCCASRLGDGVIWYVVIAALPLVAGAEGRECALHMAVAGCVSLTIYLLLKRGIARERPYLVCPEIRLCGGRVLDRFSFPSGHTLHAVGFSCILVYHFPLCALGLVPLTLVIALSRVVLGLHYPSDVLSGALVGAAVGLVSIWVL